MIARDVRGGDWSPDGRWVSFWVPYQDTTDPNFFIINVKPGFYEVSTGRICYHEEFEGTMQMEFPTTFGYWQEDSHAVIVADGGHIGSPCGDFTPIRYYAVPGWDYRLSPDGRYRAETTYQGDPVLAVTTIGVTKTGETVDTFTWRPNTGQYGGVAARWIGNRRLLIDSDVDRGPLLVTVGGPVTAVMPELFGIQSTTENINTYYVSGAYDQLSEHYHLVLSKAASEEPLKLYHSETGQVEKLSFRGLWQMNWQSGFSPDGHWLLVQMPVSQAGLNYDDEWIRPVDGAEQDTRQFARAASWMIGPSANGLVAAQNGNPGDSTLIMTFPDGKILQRWAVEGYRLSPVGWSPDGKKLLLMAYLNSDGCCNPKQTGLFLANVEP